MVQVFKNNFGLFLLLECGIDMPTEELRVVIDHAMDALRAQIVEPLEASEVQKEVQKALRDKDIEAVSIFNITTLLELKFDFYAPS